MKVTWKDFSEEKKAIHRARSAEWRRSHPEKLKEYGIKWKAENREKVRANHNRWVEANPEKFQECQKNRDKVKRRVNSQNRMNRKSGGKITADAIKKLFVLQKGKCACCGEALGDDYHVDHITPLSKGGAHEDSNIQLLRGRCNMSKNNKDPISYMQEKGFLI
jgi:5-methylcytosine-specific restriction endonuclease McrA